MLSKTLMLALRFGKRLGVRVVLMAGLAVVAALFAPALEGFIPEKLEDRFGRDAVLPILNILASSLLTVTTFSLGVMVSAFQSAASQGTPRAYRVLMQDGTTQTVLATFVSGFLFSLTALVMFNAGFYGDAAAVVIFGLTIVTIVLIVVAILRWIDLLSQLGSMDHTLWQVEEAASASLQSHCKTANLGANRLRDVFAPPVGAQPVLAPRSAYVQFINLEGLNDLLGEHDSALWLTAAPGAFVLRDQPIGHVGPNTADLAERICAHITFGEQRTMEQDSRFGLIVLSEIACRALSPGVNDPGTAIDVIQREKKLLWEYALGCADRARAEASDEETTDEVLYPRIHMPETTAEELLGDAYRVIIRDAADRIEVIVQILYALEALASRPGPMADAARDLRDYARDHAAAAITDKTDLAKLHSLVP